MSTLVEVVLAPDEESCALEAFLPTGTSFHWSLGDFSSCVCPLPGPCTCGSSLE